MEKKGMRYQILRGEEILSRMSEIDALAEDVAMEIRDAQRLGDTRVSRMGSPAAISAGISSLSRVCGERGYWIALVLQGDRAVGIVIDFLSFDSATLTVSAFELLSCGVPPEVLLEAIEEMANNHHRSVREALPSAKVQVNLSVSEADAGFFLSHL